MKFVTRVIIETVSISFKKKHTDCENCNSIRSLKCYYENEDKISKSTKNIL